MVEHIFSPIYWVYSTYTNADNNINDTNLTELCVGNYIGKDGLEYKHELKIIFDLSSIKEEFVFSALLELYHVSGSSVSYYEVQCCRSSTTENASYDQLYPRLVVPSFLNNTLNDIHTIDITEIAVDALQFRSGGLSILIRDTSDGAIDIGTNYFATEYNLSGYPAPRLVVNTLINEQIIIDSQRAVITLRKQGVDTRRQVHFDNQFEADTKRELEVSQLVAIDSKRKVISYVFSGRDAIRRVFVPCVLRIDSARKVVRGERTIADFRRIVFITIRTKLDILRAVVKPAFFAADSERRIKTNLRKVVDSFREITDIVQTFMDTIRIVWYIRKRAPEYALTEILGRYSKTEWYQRYSITLLHERYSTEEIPERPKSREVSPKYTWKEL